MSNNMEVFADLAHALGGDSHAGFVIAMKDKLRELIDENDALAELSPAVRKRVKALRELQREHDKLEKSYFEERAALEAKYQKLYKPLYAKRYEIVNGVQEVEGMTEAGSEPGEDKAAEGKGVPDFWSTALKNNEDVAGEISELDEDAMKYLKDITWFRIDEPKGFKLEFHFDTNPYFTNSVLTKTYLVVEEVEPLLDRAIGTEIEWHPGKCLTQKLLKKKPKNKKGSKNAKPITKIEKCKSFFNFFNPPRVPDKDEHIDDDASKELQKIMEQDYDVGCAIRDKIIPRAVSWFTGEAAGGDSEFDDDDDDDDDDENVEELIEDEKETGDEDEEEEDDNKGIKKKSVSAPGRDGQQGVCVPQNASSSDVMGYY